MTTDIRSGLLVLHGNRAETLAETVFHWLASHPLAPLESEHLLVQSNGMAEWLKMSLASAAVSGGVCAAATVELPARFLWRSYRQMLGRAAVPGQSPLDKTPLAWRLMQALPGLLADPRFAPVAGFLQGDEALRPWQLAQRLADLFDQYQVHRSDWLDAWGQGQEVLIDGRGAAHPLPADQSWQPALWRALLAPLGTELRAGTRPALHRRFLAALARGEAPVQPLPRRVVLFGMTHLPMSVLEALAALSAQCQVLLAIPSPCRFHWADAIDGRELLQMQRHRLPLRRDQALDSLPLSRMHAHAHPLLAAWGRQGRDFVRQLDAFDDAQQARDRFELPRIDLFDEDPATHAPWLTRVQARIRDLVPLADHAEAPLDPADHSIVFHSAHSAMRELEVLHDQLLDLLAAPPVAGQAPLQPRDIVVMVPDIEPLAPAIRAVFGQFGRTDPRHLPFDIADLGARSASPLVAALDWLLRLPQQRCRLSELRGLLEVPALARRAGFEADELARLTGWMEGAGWRWGLDWTQRDSLGLGACGDIGTGDWALQRMLLGYASGAGPLDLPVHEAGLRDASPVFAGIEPYAELGGLEAGLAGALARWLARLTDWARTAGTGATPAVWAERCRALLADVFAAGSDDERQLLAALDDAIAGWLDACEQAGFVDELELAVVREAWLGTLDEPVLNRRFRAGGVTFCTLMPMRAIPFEVVCLLGMNDGDYPRRAPRSDFDLMAQPGQGRPGDRSRRDDDRQLMLEALLSARRRLHVSWTGRDARDNSVQPPSVLVGQLRDYLASAWGAEALAQRSFEHPLQPFSRRYFEAGSAQHTWVREWRQAHLLPAGAAAAAASTPARVLASAPSSASASTSAATPASDIALDLARLTAFLRNPVKAFFRHRLQVVFDDEVDNPSDDEPFDIAGLDEHQLVDTLLSEVLQTLQTEVPLEEPAAGVRIDALVGAGLARLRRCGLLPLGGLAARTERVLLDDLGRMLRAWEAWRRRHPEPAPRQALAVTVAAAMAGVGDEQAPRLQDWLDGLRCPSPGEAPEDAPVWLQLLASRLTLVGTKKDGPRPRIDKLIGPWLRLLLATACGHRLQVVLVGRDATLTLFAPGAPGAPMSAAAAPGDRAARLAVAQTDAQAVAEALLLAWQAGQQQPLPVAPRTAIAWLGKARDADIDAATEAYEGAYRQTAEGAEACLARLFPDFDSLDAEDQFGVWAERLYAPLRDWAAGHVVIELHQAPAESEFEETES